MDLDAFRRELPERFRNWGQPDVALRTDSFSQLVQTLGGKAAPGELQLLHCAAAHLEEEELYCEIGCGKGERAISALLHNSHCSALVGDDFSQVPVRGPSYEQLVVNLKRFGVHDRVHIQNEPFETFFRHSALAARRIGLFVYAGPHDYRSQLMGLLLVRPYLMDNALLVITDAKLPEVQQATWDFLATNSQTQVLYTLLPSTNNEGCFGNGLQVMSWERKRIHANDWVSLWEGHNRIEPAN